MKWELPLCISNNLYYNETEVKRKTIGVTKLLLDDIAKQSDENDRDWQEQMDEILDVLEYAESRGLNMGGVLFGNERLYGTDPVPGDAERE